MNIRKKIDLFNYNVCAFIRKKLIKSRDMVFISVLIELFYLLFPHIISSLILVYFFPEKWFGILIVGIFLPDIYYGTNIFICRIDVCIPKFLQKIYRRSLLIPLSKSASQIKKINNVIFFALIIFLFFNKEYVIFVAGLFHIFLDFLGF